MMARIWSLNIQEAEVGESEVEGHPCLYSQFEDKLVMHGTQS